MTIHEWLNNPSDFLTGRLLYEQHGNSVNLKRIFLKAGDTERNRSTLIYELGKIAARVPEVVKEPVMIIYEHEIDKIINEGPGPLITDLVHDLENLSNDSSRVKALTDERIRLYKESSALQNQLEGMKTDDERKEAAFTILNNFDRADVIWKELESFKQDGKFPDPLPVVTKLLPTEKSEMKDMVRNLRTYISRAENGSRPKDKLLEWKADLKELERRLSE